MVSSKLDELGPEEKRALLQKLLQQRLETKGLRSAPASFAQRRMWLLNRLDPESADFNLHFGATLRGNFALDALQSAVDKVVARHEILRTSFRTADGLPEQVVSPSREVVVQLVDLSDLESAAAKALSAERILEARLQPFDLENGPLLRVFAYRLEPDVHVLLLVVHHIVADGWSIGVLFRDLSVFYESACTGKADSLEPLPMQFIDFANRQRQDLAGEKLRRQLDYWRGQLANMPPPLDLPFDGARQAHPTREAQIHRSSLEPGDWERLKALGRNCRTTPYMTLLAVLQVLLSRVCGESDVVVGSPIAGRTMPRTEEMIGFFVNMLVLRTDLSGDPTFRDALARVREVAHQAFAHQEVPFERLLEELNPDREPGRTPFFQVYLNMLNFQSFDLSPYDLEAEPFPFEYEANFDLILYVKEDDGRLDLVFVTRRGLMSEARLAALHDQYRMLLLDILRDPDRTIGSLALAGTESASGLPDPCQPLPEPVYPAGTLTLPSLAAHGNRPAVIGPRLTLSYRELDRAADDLARRLIAAGVDRGAVVAVIADRDPGLVVALLGILRAGAAFAVLDPAYPEERLVERARAAGAVGAVSVNGAIARLASLARCNELRFVVEALSGDVPGGETPLPSLTDSDLAYVAFTSGTTGEVKAIAGNHGPVAHFLNWQRSEFGLGPDDRMTMLSGLGHDPLLRDVFAPLACGAGLHVPSAEVFAEPLRLADWLADLRPTAMHLTPALSDMLGSVMAAGSLTGLRFAFYGGEALSAACVERMRGLAPDAEYVNFYGATETPQAMGFHRVKSGDRLSVRTPIGKGIDGVQLLVVNPADNAAGVGELGEIRIRTPFLSRGYLGDDAFTRTRFVRNTATVDADDRVYRTGDLGRYLPDGSVEFIRRGDDQVKIRGFRIELGEVEAALRSHPAVEQTAATLCRAGTSDAYIAVFFTGAELDQAAVRDFLADRLPDYAIPSAVMRLDRLPLTPAGKIDRRALPELSLGQADNAFEAPVSDTETLIAEVFAEVLGHPQVGRHDDFFALGGHSLAGAQVIARLRARLGVEPLLQRLFDAPTPANLARHLDAQLAGTSAENELPELRIESRPALVPLSFAQERLWFLSQMSPDSAAYNLAGALRCAGQIDVDALRASLATIVSRHESLRTRFAVVNGQPTQVFDADAGECLDVVELDDAAHVQEMIGKVVDTPFDLGSDRLIRAVLVRLSPDLHILLIVTHHIVSDGWSMGVFVRELEFVYRSLMMHRKPDLSPLPLQYADYAVWQRTWLAGDTLARQLEYWRKQLADAPAYLELPLDRPRPATFEFRGGRETFVIDRHTQENLAQLARQSRATMFMVLLAGFQLFLARLSRQSDILVGTPVASRHRPEFEGLIGFFANTLVMRTRVADAGSFADLVAAVRETCLGAYAHQDMPFEKLVEDLQPERDLSRNPVFQVMLAMQNMELPELKLPELELSQYPIDRTTAQVDLTLYLRETGDGIEGAFEFSSDLFSRAAVRQWVDDFRELIARVAADPGEAIAAIPLVSELQAAKLAEWNDTTEVFEGPSSLHGVALQVCGSRANTLAVSDGRADLSYSELAERVGRIASYLHARGIGQGDLVGVLMDRSVDMLVAMLGVLRAGAGYVPLDPAYPDDRIDYMLQDSKACAVLTGAVHTRRLDVPSGCVVIDLAGEADAWAGADPKGPPVEERPDDIAYVIYTSGSTGKPKGVAVPHRAAANFLHSMRRVPGIGPDDTLVAVTTISFDISVLELFLPLSAGARLVIADREVVADGRRLRELVESSGTTVLQATPSLWNVLFESGWQGSRELRVLCGGEPFPPDLAARLHGCCGEVWNMYGPTETTVWSLCDRIEDPHAPITVGRPIANTSVYVLDEAGRLLPPLIAGEVFIGGSGVTLGYLNREELSAERFLPDPYSSAVGSRMYRTGDQARWLPDGRLEHLGRLDDQVKVRGYRIELGEIEATLRQHPGVRAAAVKVHAVTAGDQRLVAYVVTSGGSVPTTELRKHLRQTLPDYMVPQLFTDIDELPLTANGKIDRKALPDPFAGQGIEVDKGGDPPQGEIEEAIAAVWRETIGLGSPVSRTDNFFELGGHSLLAIKAIVEIEQKTGFRPTPRQMVLESLQQIAAYCPAPGANTVQPSGLRGLVGRLIRRRE